MPLQETPYQNSGLTFLKSRLKEGDGAGLVDIVGIPFDGSCSYGVGSRFGPDAVRKASAMLTDGHHPELGIDPSRSIIDHGDIIVGSDFTHSHFAIQDAIAGLAKQDKPKPVFSIGGDHSVTLSILRGLQKSPAYSPDMSLIIFDAHCDTWGSNFGIPLGHGTWVRDAIKEEIVRPENIMQVGLRSPVDPETRRWLLLQGGRTASIRTASKNPDAIAWPTRGGVPCYISVDIDVLDPAFAPGTGTPEVGGLTTDDLLYLLGEGLRHSYGRLIGADVVEIAPPYDDRREITALAGARILYEMICRYLATQSRG